MEIFWSIISVRHSLGMKLYLISHSTTDGTTEQSYTGVMGRAWLRDSEGLLLSTEKKDRASPDWMS